jgi:hypothetical protein
MHDASRLTSEHPEARWSVMGIGSPGSPSTLGTEPSSANVEREARLVRSIRSDSRPPLLGMEVAACMFAGVLLLATTYPARSTSATDGPTLSVQPSGGFAGGQVFVSGTGFWIGEPLDVYLAHREVAVVTADRRGSFERPRIDIPPGARPGSRWISVVGRSSGRWAQAAMRVVGTEGWPRDHADLGRTNTGPRTPGSLSVVSSVWARPPTDGCDGGGGVPLISAKGLLFGGCWWGSMESGPMKTILWARSLATGRDVAADVRAFIASVI